MNALAWIESAGFVDGEFALRLTLTLLHFLWQGAAIALAVSFVCRVLSQANARSRYAVSLSGLLLMALCVAVTFMLIPRQRLDTAEAIPAAAPGPNATLAAEPATGLADDLTIRDSDDQAVSLALSSSTTASAPQLKRGDFPVALASANPEDPEPSSLAHLARVVAAAYLVGVAFMLSRLALALCGGQRMRRCATPVDDPSLLLLVRRQAERLGLAVVPLVCMCERVAVPVVVGVLRPTILIPSSLLSGLSPDQLQALFLHELAHIRRLDLFANLVQRVIESLLFFHPAAWYVSRRVSAERENCCDDLVVSAGCDRVQYAGALIRFAEIYAAQTNYPRAPHATALAASGTRQTEFRRRVLRLLDSKPRIRLSRSGAMAALVVLLGLMVLPVTAPHWVAVLTADDEVRSTSQQNNELSFEPNAENAAPPAPMSPGIDLYGDHLPEGAILRLGTARFQSRWRTGQIAFSPNGEFLAATGAYDSLRVWNAKTGKLISEVKQGIMSQIATALAVSHDGRHVAIGGEDGVIKVYTAPVGVEIFSHRQPGFGSPVRAIAFSSTGVLASTGEDGQVIIWDIFTGEERDSLRHVSDVGERSMRLAFSPNGDVLASSCHNNIRIWKLGEKPECTYIAQAHEHEVSNLVFTSDGKSLITAGHNFETPQTPPQSQLRIWDTETGQRRGELFEEVGTYFSGLAVRDEGQTLIAATPGRVYLFDLASATLRQSFEIYGPFASTTSVWSDVSPDGKTFAYTRWDSAIRRVDLRSGESALPERNSHEAMIRAVAFSPDGHRIVTGSGDGTVRIWDATSGRQLQCLEFSPRCMNFFALACSPDGQLVAAAGDFSREGELRQVGLVKVWNALSGEPWHEFQLEGAPYFNVAFSHDASLLAAAPKPRRRFIPGEQEHAIHHLIDVFRMDNGRKLATLAGHGGTSLAMAFSPNDDAVNSAGEDMTVRFWKLPGGEPIATHSIEDVNTAAFSPDATIVATSSGLPLYRVTTRNVATGEVIHKIQTKSGFGAHAMDISDDGKLLATGCQEDTIFVWDMATGRQLLKIHSPDATVFALAFDPSGERLVTGMDDGTALVWDVSASRDN